MIANPDCVSLITLSLALTHLYWIVSDVVEALSFVIRILTMLKRKIKLICRKKNTVCYWEKLGNDITLHFHALYWWMLIYLNNLLHTFTMLKTPPSFFVVFIWQWCIKLVLSSVRSGLIYTIFWMFSLIFHLNIWITAAWFFTVKQIYM